MQISSAVDIYCRHINQANAARRRRCSIAFILAAAAAVCAYHLVEEEWLRTVAVTCGAAVASFSLALRPWLLSWGRLRRDAVVNGALLDYLTRSRRVPAEAKAALADQARAHRLVTVGFLRDLDAHLERLARPARPQLRSFAPKGSSAAAAA